MTSIINRCESSGLRMTEQRRVIAKVLDVSKDHPDVDIIYSRVSKIDNSISIATVYRTVKQFEEAGIIDRVDFGDGRARYEDAKREHHDHLIDIQSGNVIEFVDPEIELLQERIAERLGYELRGHRLELENITKILSSDEIASNMAKRALVVGKPNAVSELADLIEANAKDEL